MSITNNVEMDSALHHNSRLDVKRTFFNLIETIFYSPSHSKIEGEDLELDAETGEKIKELLELPDDSVYERSMKMNKVSTVENGMYNLSVYYSEDHQFAALQLTKYLSFEYRPVTAIRFLENETAESLLGILLK